MQALGIPFEVMPADIDEKGIIESDQKLRAKLIAKAKAEEVLKMLQNEVGGGLNSEVGGENNLNPIIIAADTFTMFNGKAYEKPESKEEAMQMLQEQSGQTGVCFSGFAYIDKKNKIELNDVAVTEIVFRKLSDSEIQRYVDENPVMTWSAAFCPAYPAGANLIASIKGSFTSFTHGLPMEMLVPLLEKSGAINEEA